jgi:hypothetical protein
MNDVKPGHNIMVSDIGGQPFPLNKTSIYKKLLTFQKEFGTIKKNKKNPHFRSSYADINGVLKEIKFDLNDLGLLILQPITGDNGESFIHTQIIDSDSGEKIESFTSIKSYEIIPNPCYKNPDHVKKRVFEINWLQKFGAGVTYTRRIALISLLGLEQAEESRDGSSKNQYDNPTYNKKASNKQTYSKVQTYDFPKTTPPLSGAVNFRINKIQAWENKYGPKINFICTNLDNQGTIVFNLKNEPDNKRLTGLQNSLGISDIRGNPKESIGKEARLKYLFFTSENGKEVPYPVFSKKKEPVKEEQPFNDDIPF